MDERGGLVTAADLAAYRPYWREPVACAYAGARVLTRAGLSRVAETLARAAHPVLRVRRNRERSPSCELSAVSDIHGHTTNVTVVDPAGNACVVTTSLGLGSGDFLPGLDIHLNSMLGESELLVGELDPGERMQSMMAPTVAVDADGLALAAGSAGGSRLRSALVQVLAGILDEGLRPDLAVERPRLHPADGVVHAEPGLPEGVYAALEEHGYRVNRWAELHHYFGGTSVVASERFGRRPEKERPRTHARLGRHGSLRGSRVRDVHADLVDQRLLTLEGALLAQPLPDLERGWSRRRDRLRNRAGRPRPAARPRRSAG